MKIIKKKNYITQSQNIDKLSISLEKIFFNSRRKNRFFVKYKVRDFKSLICFYYLKYLSNKILELILTKCSRNTRFYKNYRKLLRNQYINYQLFLTLIKNL